MVRDQDVEVADRIGRRRHARGRSGGIGEVGVDVCRGAELGGQAGDAAGVGRQRVAAGGRVEALDDDDGAERPQSLRHRMADAGAPADAGDERAATLQGPVGPRPGDERAAALQRPVHPRPSSSRYSRL